MHRTRGFSLVELLIVIAVILILTALAVPQLLRARIAANESAAVAAVRSLHTAQLEYAQLYPTAGFADDISKLGPPANGMSSSPTHANLLDFVLGCAAQPCLKQGYMFSVDQVSGSPVDTFRITAVPAVPNNTGIRGFCGTLNGVISFDPAGGTNCTTPI
jgi:type IV pilus assembly protein PilA